MLEWINIQKVERLTPRNDILEVVEDIKIECEQIDIFKTLK